MTQTDAPDDPRPALRPAPPRMWRLPVPPRLAGLPDGEKIGEACRLAAGGMPALQAAATCGLAWAAALLDQAVALGEQRCLKRLIEIKYCAQEAYLHYDDLAWRAQADASAFASPLRADWTTRAGEALAPRWGLLGLVYAYEQQPEFMVTLKPAFLEVGDAELADASPDHPAALLEANGEEDQSGQVTHHLTTYQPMDLYQRRHVPSPEPELLPGLARARGWVSTETYDCAGPVFGYASTGVRPPLAERSHEAQAARAAKRDRLGSTRAPKASRAQRWHLERIEAITELANPEPEEEDPEDRPGYAFWGGQPMNAAGPRNGTLLEQHQPKTLPDRLPKVYARFDRLVPRRETVEAPTALALWWALLDPETDALKDHGSAVRAFLLENAHYWDRERVHLEEIRLQVQREARAEGVPEWPTPESVTRAADRSDKGRRQFDGAAYHAWATKVIATYCREQLAHVTDAEAAMDRLWHHGPDGHRMTEGQLRAAAMASQDTPAVRSLVERLFTPDPPEAPELTLSGEESWCQRPQPAGPGRKARPALNGRASEIGEEVALNRLDQFTAAVRGGHFGPAPKRLLAFAHTLRNFLDSALGSSTMPGRGGVKWLIFEGQPCQLRDLVQAEAWRTFQETMRPERGVFGPNPHLADLYAYLADPHTLYTVLAPAVLWLHQVCFGRITGHSYRLYVSPRELAKSAQDGFVQPPQVQEILTAGALGQMTDMAFRTYDPECAAYCPDWRRRDWTLTRLRDLAVGAYVIAARAKDGGLVGHDSFRAFARAVGYSDAAIARGLARVGQGLAVAVIPGFTHLDQAYRDQEALLKADGGLSRGLLGDAWAPTLTDRDGTPHRVVAFAQVLDAAAGFVPAPPHSPQGQSEPDEDRLLEAEHGVETATEALNAGDWGDEPW